MLESISIIASVIKRINASEIQELVDNFSAVAILGPRQVGKTTLARDIVDQRDSIYLDLEPEEDRHKLINPTYYLRQHQNRLVVLDEIQRVPEIFQPLCGLIDENRRQGHRSGQYLILGSASLE